MILKSRVVQFILLAFTVAASSESLSQSFWKQCTLPPGDRIRQLLVIHQDTVVALTEQRVILYSENAGLTWAVTGHTSMVGCHLAINHRRELFEAGVAGVYRSSDLGATWSDTCKGISSFPIRSIACGPDSIVYVGTDEGVFRSTDNGTHWTNPSSTRLGSSVEALAVLKGGTVIAGTPSAGVFRSTDSGAVWIHSSDGLTGANVNVLAVDSTVGILAGTDADGLFVSGDEGLRWASIYPGTTVHDVSTDGRGRILAACELGLWHSTDRGVTWNRALPTGWSAYLAAECSTALLVGDYSSLVRSTDRGVTWAPSWKYTIYDYVSAVAIDSAGSVFAATDGGIFRSKDSGNSWTRVSDVRGYSLCIHTSGSILAGTGSGDILRSTDGGNGWTTVRTIPGGSFAIQGFAMNSQGDLFAACAGDGILRSTDGGVSWTNIIAPFTPYPVECIAVDLRGTVLAGMEVTEGIFRSTDNGTTWVKVTKGLENVIVMTLGVGADGKVYAGSQKKGIFVSTDHGLSWTGSGGDFSNTTIRTFSINALGDIFAGTQYSGVYRSTDGGMNWEARADGLGFGIVLGLTHDQAGYLYAGIGFPAAVYRTHKPTVSRSIESPHPAAGSFAMAQNYPNPFNLSTKIPFTLPGSMRVTVTIYNTLGQKVKELVTTEFGPGYHEVDFDASGLATGFFFCRLDAVTTAGGSSQSYHQMTKLLLLR